MDRLEGKIALITGGTRGIGRAIAEAYLAEGASVAINGRSEANGEIAVKELDAGERIIFLQGDVTVKEDVERLVDGTVAHFGRLDILVNNAGGIQAFAPVAEMPDSLWEHTLDFNLNSTFWATRRAIPHMVGQGWGRIINISSLEGKYGLPLIAPYVVSKHAVHGFTKTVAKEVGRFGVTCNALCPGLVPETDLAQTLGASIAPALGVGSFDGLMAMFAERSALGRTTTLADCTGPAVLLASDAGAGITGVALSIDGGISEF